MDKDTFLKMQYEALRQEILATQKRNMQTLGFGALSVPVAGYLATVHDIPALSLTLPLLVLGVALLYLADSHGIIRCGEYIREHIEAELAGPDVVGWETWLEMGRERTRRSTERYTTWCFYLMFLLYFVAAVYMVRRFAVSAYRWEVAAGITLTYCLLGCGAGYHIVRSLRLTTTHAAHPDALLSKRTSKLVGGAAAGDITGSLETPNREPWDAEPR